MSITWNDFFSITFTKSRFPTEHIVKICSLEFKLSFHYICSIRILNIVRVIAKKKNEIFKNREMRNQALVSIVIASIPSSESKTSPDCFHRRHCWLHGWAFWDFWKFRFFAITFKMNQTVYRCKDKSDN